MTYLPLKHLFLCLLLAIKLVLCYGCENQNAAGVTSNKMFAQDTILTSEIKETPAPILDTALYNLEILRMVHNQPFGGWPVKTEYPLPGARWQVWQNGP